MYLSISKLLKSTPVGVLGKVLVNAWISFSRAKFPADLSITRYVLISASTFVAIPRFNEAVLKAELHFQGFNRIFDQLVRQGYDPREIGWGELRFVAVLNS